MGIFASSQLLTNNMLRLKSLYHSKINTFSWNKLHEKDSQKVPISHNIWRPVARVASLQ